MAVSNEEFRRATGMFMSLQPLATDRQGRITAIAVTIAGAGGRTGRQVLYRILASVDRLEAELPKIWIASPPDSEIRHVNIFRAAETCPFTGTRLPTLCWGITPRAWTGTSTSERRLANLLEAVRQVLAVQNHVSAARS